MDTLLAFGSLVLHIDKFLGVFIQQYGAWVYAVLFLIVFCETGLVVFPFLPATPCYLSVVRSRLPV